MPPKTAADTSRLAVRLDTVQRIVLAAFAVGMSWSIPLWVTDRPYPLAPVLPVNLPGALGVVVPAAFALAAAASFLTPRSRAPLYAILACLAWLALGDQTRWQPWAYQYTGMLAILAWLRAVSPDDESAAPAALSALRIVLAGIYLWAGLQKLNVNYFSGTFGTIVSPLESVLPAWLFSVLVAAGPLTPFLEIAIGAGLAFERTRVRAAAAAVAMHVFVLAMVGPWGRDWNSIVWPWNAAMIALALLLFGPGSPRIHPADIFRPASRAATAAAVAFLLLPALSLVDRWDAYLSASLYSRNLRHASITVSPRAQRMLPEGYREHVDDDGIMWPILWALDTMNVPAYPAARVYRALAVDVCRHTGGRGVDFGLSTKPGIFTGEIDVERATCAALGAGAP